MNWIVFTFIPVLVVWALVLVDIARQPHMRRGAKLAWALACALIWPMLVAYWLTRPIPGRISRTEPGSDPRRRLVDLVLAHESGEIDDASMAQRSRELRGG